MATSPIMMFAAEKLISIDVIPRNSKLNPIIMDTTAELKTGQIIKINPKIIDNIPDTLFNSIFFPPNFVIFTFQVKTAKLCNCSNNVAFSRNHRNTVNNSG